MSRRGRQQSAFNAHRRGTHGNHVTASAAAPKKISKRELKKVAMEVEVQLRRSARLGTRKNGPTANAAEKRKEKALASISASAVKKAVKSASAKTVSLLYPSLLSGSAPGVLKSKIDSAWRAYIEKKRHNAGIIRGRVNREPADASLNALSARLSESLGRNQSTRYAGPKRHHLTMGNERRLAVIAENENE